MKSGTFLSLLGGAAASWMLSVQPVAAISLVNITQSDLPGYLAAVDGNTVACVSTPQGDKQIFEWLTHQVTSAGYTAPQDGVLIGGGSANDLDLGDYVGEYLVVHWGNGPANQLFEKNDKPAGGFNQVFLITNEDPDTSLVDLALPFLTDGKNTKKVGGMSYWRVYDPPSTSVPDAGATAMLLGGAFGLLHLARRKTVTK